MWCLVLVGGDLLVYVCLYGVVGLHGCFLWDCFGVYCMTCVRYNSVCWALLWFWVTWVAYLGFGVGFGVSVIRLVLWVCVGVFVGFGV